MNSTKDVQPNGIHAEEPSTSAQIANADSNANLRNGTNHHKGAIPKIKPTKSKTNSFSKKSIKINNNVEELPSCHMKNDLLSLNGMSNGTSASVLDPFINMHASSSNSRMNNMHIEDQALNIPVDEMNTVHECSSNLRDNCKRDNSDSSSEDNELLSVSDDGCIYTYKGDQMADLPSSFFSLDIPPPENPERILPNRQQSSSPEMDFLEMDFDPGPSEDANSECSEVQNAENLPEDVKSPEENASNLANLDNDNKEEIPIPVGVIEISKLHMTTKNHKELNATMIKSETEINKSLPWFCPFSQRTTSATNMRYSRRYHITKGELMSPVDKMTLVEPASKVINSTKLTEENLGIEEAMVWMEGEAYLKQFSQIGASGCGATAVLNVLNALRFPIPPIEKLQECVNTRLRSNSSPLAEYLLSRSEAGAAHNDLIEGLSKLSNNHIYARFFHMYPERIANLYTWLGFWIKNGAVPIATLNLQKCSGSIPDAWHHQMIFGVGPKGIYLTNPLECVEANQLWPQLCSESVLLIRREDVLSRWNFKTDLPQLMTIANRKWRQINVVGQVANMIHESRRELRPGFTNTSHIRIPAAYSSGITLAISVDSPAYSLLRHCPELPELNALSNAFVCTDNT